MSFTGSIHSRRLIQHADDVPLCECNAPCKGPIQVKKQNHNHGRWFYCCQSGACNFFKWAPDQPNPSSNSAGDSNSSPSGRSGGHGNFPASGGRILGRAGGVGEALQGGGVPWTGGSPSSLIGSPSRSVQQQYQAQHVQGSPYAFGQQQQQQQQEQQQQQQLMGSPVLAAQRLRQAHNSQGPSPSKSADGGGGQLVVHLELMEGAPDRFVSKQRYSRDFIDAVKSTDRRSTDYAWDAEERVWTYALTYVSFTLLRETLEREGFRVVSAPALMERLGILSQEAFAGMKHPGPGHPHSQAPAAVMGDESPSSHRSKLRRVNLFRDEAPSSFPSMEFDLAYFSQGTQAAGGAHASGSGLGRGKESKQESAVPSRGAHGARLPGAAGSAEEVMVVAERRGPLSSQQGPQGRHRSRQAGRGTVAAGNSVGELRQQGSSPSVGSGAGGDGRVYAVIDLTLTDDEGEREQRGGGVRSVGSEEKATWVSLRPLPLRAQMQRCRKRRMQVVLVVLVSLLLVHTKGPGWG